MPLGRFVSLLIASSLAAVAAGLGALLAASRRADAATQQRLGWASALAAGLMLGVAYAVMEAGLGLDPAAAGAAAMAGIGFVHAARGLPATRAGWVAEAPMRAAVAGDGGGVVLARRPP